MDSSLLDILVCPLSRAPLILDESSLISTDPDTRRRYRIEDGIPVLLIEEGEEMDREEWEAAMKRHVKK